MRRVERDGAPEGCRGVFQGAGFAQRIAEIEMHFRRAWINRQRAAEANQRGFGSAEILEHETLIGMGGDIAGREQAGAFIRFKCGIGCAGGAQQIAEDEMRRSRIGLKRNRLLQRARRRRTVPAL